MDIIAAAFQKASGSGVAHSPTTTKTNPKPGANTPTAANPEYRPRLARTEGDRASRQNPAKDNAVSNERPLVLVYSPRTAMASAISTAAAKEAANPARNVRGFM